MIHSPSLLGLMPPTKPDYSVPFETFRSHKWLKQNIQQCWWKINKSSRSEIGTSSEFCLIKEIIWMFIKPTDCKFFSINNSTLTINYTLNVTIGSISQVNLFFCIMFFGSCLFFLLIRQSWPIFLNRFWRICR